MARIVVTILLTTTCVCRSPPQVPFPTSLSFTQEVETALESFDFLDCADLDEEEEAAKDEEQEQEDKEEVEEEKEGEEEEEEEKVKEENGQQEETENKMEDEIVAKEEKQEEKFYCGGRSVPRFSRLTRLLIVLLFN